MDPPSWPAPAAHPSRPVTLFPTYQPSPPPSPRQIPLQPYPQPPQPPPLPLPLPSPPPETPATRARRARTLTTASHALTLTTVFGIPASSPLWLEYYFTTLYPGTSLQMLGVVFAALMGGVLGGVAGGGWWWGVSGKGKGKGKEKREKRWRRRARLPMLLSALVATISFAVLAALAALQNPVPSGRDTGVAVWVLVLLQGALPGLALGFCAAGSMRLLGSHYGHKAGRVGHVAGWAGAVVYSVGLWAVLRSGEVGAAYGVVAGGAVVTLGSAVVLARPCESGCGEKGAGTATMSMSVSMPHVEIESRRCRVAVEAATALVVPVLVLPLLFATLVLVEPPPLSRPDTAVRVLLALYAAAAVSSSLVPHVDLVRLSREVLLAGCLAIAALATVPLIWERTVWVTVYWAVIYGAAVGGVGVLVAKDGGDGEEGMGKGIGGEADEELMWSWESVLIRGVGLVVGVGGVVGCAVLIVSVDNGVEIVLGVVVGMLGVAAVCMGVLGLIEEA